MPASEAPGPTLGPDGWLSAPACRLPSPNHGGAMRPALVVMHFTATTTRARAIDILTDPDRPEGRVSAHLVVDRDGRIDQLLPFTTIGWHAGISRWAGRTGLNACSVGIELVNAGPVTPAPGREGWLADDGTALPPGCPVAESTHRLEPAPRRWEVFPPAQIAAARQIIGLLAATYPIETVLGHDLIAPDRKRDPGPLFPWPLPCPPAAIG